MTPEPKYKRGDIISNYTGIIYFVCDSTSISYTLLCIGPHDTNRHYATYSPSEAARFTFLVTSVFREDL